MWHQIIGVGRHFQSKSATRYLRNIPDVISLGCYCSIFMICFDPMNCFTPFCRSKSSIIGKDRRRQTERRDRLRHWSRLRTEGEVLDSRYSAFTFGSRLVPYRISSIQQRVSIPRMQKRTCYGYELANHLRNGFFNRLLMEGDGDVVKPIL